MQLKKHLKKIGILIALVALGGPILADSGKFQNAGNVIGIGSVGDLVFWQNSNSISSNPTPVDPTNSISTVGTSGVYSETTVTNVTSSIDPTITNLGYRRVYDTGHAATGKLIPTVLLTGFGQNGISTFPDSMAERMAAYVDPITGRAPLVIKAQTRGRGNLGTIDYARDAQDVADIITHATNAVGSNVYGYGTNGGTSAIVVGYSTGGLDALNFAARFPDRTLGVVLYYPNYDIGADPKDSYYPLQSSTVRAQIATSVQPGGDVRLTPGAASVDQYLARNAIDAIARVVAIPGGPHVWLIGDLDEIEILPSFTRLRDALQSIPAAKGKVHIHLTQTGDSNRVLHADGVNGASEIYAERYYFPYLLKNAAEWTMPRRSPPGGLRLLGWMKTKLFEVWMGPNTAPKTAASAGGKDHAAEFQYDDYTRRFKILPTTSTNGYFEVIRDADDRSTAFTAGTELIVDLNVSRQITAVTDIGMQYSFRADSGVTNSSGVTNWVDSIGGSLAFTASTNKPSYTTDADAKSLIRFSAVSSQKLVMNSLLLNPTQDFTVCAVANKTTDTTQGYFFEMSHHGTLARTGMGRTASSSLGYAYNDDGNWALTNTNGIGGQTWSINAKHVTCLMRKSNYLYMSLDGSSWFKSSYGTENFTQTGTNTTSLGAGWANSGGAYWQFFTGDIYEIDAKQAATSEADVFSYNALMKSRWTF